MSKILVSYFSASGVTEGVAKNIAECIKGDLFEIEPVYPYTEEDLDWTNHQSRSSIEMNDPLSRPEVKNKVVNLSNYDIVCLGFPVWWDLAPTIVNTFIEENNLEDKKIYVFVTSGSSSADHSFQQLKETYRNLHFVSAKRLTSDVLNSDIINWIKGGDE